VYYTRIEANTSRTPEKGRKNAERVVSVSDQRRLEIRGDGVGPTVLVDIHVGRDHGIRGHHPAGAHVVRQPAADQRPAVGNTAARAHGETELQ